MLCVCVCVDLCGSVYVAGYLIVWLDICSSSVRQLVKLSNENVFLATQCTATLYQSYFVNHALLSLLAVLFYSVTPLSITFLLFPSLHSLFFALTSL